MRKITQIFFMLLFGFIITSAQNGVVKTYYPNGTVQSETSYVNDVLDGASISYYPNGKIAAEKNFSQGVLDGFVREFYDTGKLKLEYSVKNGIKDGAYSMYNKDGILTELINYNLGEATKKEVFMFVQETVAEEKFAILSADSGKTEKALAEKSLDAAPVMEKRREARVNIISEPKREEAELLSKVKSDQVNRPDEKDEILCDVQICPEPVGGMKAIQQNLIYPEHALLYGLEGTVSIIATIDREGKVTRTQVLKGIGYGCDEEAQIALRKTKFTPGIQNGIAAETNATIKIIFKVPGKN